VRATKTGYYEHTIRQVGDVFIQDDAISPFSEKWMEPVDDDVPEKITGSNAIIQQEHDAIVRQKLNLGSGDPTDASTGATGDKKVARRVTARRARDAPPRARRCLSREHRIT
jgi:hypothetical protein